MRLPKRKWRAKYVVFRKKRLVNSAVGGRKQLRAGPARRVTALPIVVCVANYTWNGKGPRLSLGSRSTKENKDDHDKRSSEGHDDV
jgi:hypothetical protein